jgi:hypothetical protein
VGASVSGYVLNRGEAMDSLQDQLQTASYVRSITEDNDKILVYPYEPSIYFLSDRTPCVKLLILYPSMGKDIESDLLQEIIDNEPRFVVVQSTSDNRIIMGLPLIYNFIVNHFHEIARMQAYIILGKE